MAGVAKIAYKDDPTMLDRFTYSTVLRSMNRTRRQSDPPPPPEA